MAPARAEAASASRSREARQPTATLPAKTNPMYPYAASSTAIARYPA